MAEMNIDEVKVQAFIKQAKTALKYWGMWPKHARAEVRMQVAKGWEGYRDYFIAFAEQDDALDAACKGMNLETKAKAVEAALADESLIELLVSKAGQSKPKPKEAILNERRRSFVVGESAAETEPSGDATGGAVDQDGTLQESLTAEVNATSSEGAEPSAAEPKKVEPAATQPRRRGINLKEGQVEVERLWLQPVPLLGRTVALGWRHQYVELRRTELLLYETKPKRASQPPSSRIALRGASVTDTKQQRKGRCAFRLNFVPGREFVQGHKLIMACSSLEATLEWVEAFRMAGVLCTFEGRGMTLNNLAHTGASDTEARASVLIASRVSVASRISRRSALRSTVGRESRSTSTTISRDTASRDTASRDTASRDTTTRETASRETASRESYVPLTPFRLPSPSAAPLSLMERCRLARELGTATSPVSVSGGGYYELDRRTSVARSGNFSNMGASGHFDKESDCRTSYTILEEEEIEDETDDEEEEEEEPSDLFMEAMLINQDDPDEKIVEKIRKREYDLPLLKALFGTKLLRAVWLCLAATLVFTLFDIAMISARCERGAAHCCYAFFQAAGTTSISVAIAMGVYTVYPPILRRFAVNEVKRRQSPNEEQTCGQKYCYGSLIILPNFVASVGTFFGVLGAAILVVSDGYDFSFNVWTQVWSGMVIFYVLSLDVFMKQNDRQGSGYYFWLLAELPCYPEGYRLFMDQWLKRYMFPDLWGMLVLGVLNVLAIPIVVPYALINYAEYPITYVACLAAVILFVASALIYMACSERYGGGLKAAMQFELDEQPTHSCNEDLSAVNEESEEHREQKYSDMI